MNGTQINSLLDTFVRSSDAGEQEGILSALLHEHAQPIAKKIIRYKTRGAIEEAEEIGGEVMLQLVARLEKTENR